MEPKKRDGRAKRAVSITRGLEQFWIDASDEELCDALKDAGEDPEQVSSEGREAVRRALEAAQDEQGALGDLHRGLGALLVMLRRRDQVSIEDLAKRAQVSPEELKRIERDPDFTAHVRTIHKLEHFFSLPARTLVVLSGAIQVDSVLRGEVQRFAASSTGLSKLTSEEKRQLNRFVKILRQHTDR